ncbi:hypothetical protein EXN22_14085 [Pseudomonas tructae]|uniref:Uncharacterized protein n=1 Tax=Pseudomonas tructae TaxID=2518644 RepID=A0A411MJ06_9PSED|nr:hypothetical protein [Pseudomonas tructae]QBF26768.1 hypothetical protein EXN22_14085 [Pseudomonas tructae]
MRTTCSLLLILGSLVTSEVFADACDVVSRSSSEAVKSIERHTCYSYSNMPADAIDWSCSNESKEMVSAEKRKVLKCADGSIGVCSAPLTQESLSNPKSAGRDVTPERLPLTSDARVITWYYDMEHLGQARSDCERSDGTWQTQ